MLKSELKIWCSCYTSANNPILPTRVSIGDYGAEKDLLDVCFSGIRASECPWMRFVDDPELLAFMDEDALAIALPWLILIAGDSVDLTVYLMSTLTRVASEDPSFMNKLESRYFDEFLNCTIEYLGRLIDSAKLL